MAGDMTLGEASIAIGVSINTLRRWDRLGTLRTHRDSRNRRLVSRAEVQRLTTRPDRHQTSSNASARNRFPGIVRSVKGNGVMALVEIDAAGVLIVAAITRDAAEELGLAPGVPATAIVKATSMMLDINRD